MKIICFDIGGTKILKSVIKISGKKYKFLDLREEKNPRKAKEIRGILNFYCCEAKINFKTEKVSISTTRIVDPILKLVNDTEDRYGVSSFSFRFLEKKGFRVQIENDGQCFALGEYFFGKSGKMQSALTLALGTGIGGGFIWNKTIFSGAHHSALEVSHSRFYFEGKWGEWAEIAGGRGMEQNYYHLSEKKLSAEDIFGEARENNKLAGRVIRKAEESLGMGIANLINILDPEIIVFGGGISEQKDFLKNAVMIARKNVFNKKANYKFAISSLGNKANLLGAATLYRKFF